MKTLWLVVLPEKNSPLVVLQILEVTMLMTSYINSRGQQHKSGAGRGGGDARDTVRKSYTASQYSTLMHTFTKVSSTMEV